jgi:SPP1 gp7 family putative phage head morphogenesis protein
MKSEAYWSKRLEELNEAMLSRGERYIQSMQAEYDKAMASIQRDIDVFYKRFSDNNGIVDMASARQVLKAGELKEFKWTVEDYIEKGRENAVDQRWMKELENASIRVRVSRLEALQTQMRQQVEVLAAKRQTGTQELLGGIYKDNYHHSIFELQKGAGFGSSFAKLDKEQVDKLLSRPWAPDGTNFSERIWKDRDKLLHELQTTITQGLIRGDPSEKLISDLAERMGVSRSAAARVVLTESAYFAGQSRLDAYHELGVEQYKFLATLDNRTSVVCRGMDGKVFPLNEAQAGVNYPPLHVYCRSTTIPHYDDNINERAARDDKGNTYMVPGDMTYAEWEKKHVEPEPPTSLKSKDNVSGVGPDSVQPKKVDEIDPEDDAQLTKKLQDVEEIIRNEPEEHAYIFTKDGDVYYTVGDANSVDIDVVGEDNLRDSIVTHNHPNFDGEPGGSFSKDDVVAFFTYGLQELRAVDSQYNYRLSRKGEIDITLDDIRAFLEEAEDNHELEITLEEALVGRYDSKHLTMRELIKLIQSLVYERSEAP